MENRDNTITQYRRHTFVMPISFKSDAMSIHV